jgi:hypothetical protein
VSEEEDYYEEELCEGLDPNSLLCLKCLHYDKCCLEEGKKWFKEEVKS